MALRATALSALLPALLAVGLPAAAQTPSRGDAAPRERPAPSFQPSPPFESTPPAPSDTWIFSGVLDDGREPYSGTLLTGSDASGSGPAQSGPAQSRAAEVEVKLGAGVSCAGGGAALGPGAVRLSDIPCSDDRTMGIVFVPRGDADLTVFGQVGARRFTASAHRLGTDAPGAPARDAAPRALPPAAAPPAAPANPSPRNG